jgi:stage III sporulation protein AD
MIKIVLLAVVFSVILYFLKNVNSDIFVPALICSGVILTSYSISYLQEVFDFVNTIVGLSKLDFGYYKIIIKIIGLSYLVEFGASTVEDIGYKSIADKLVLVGKIMILVVALPIFYVVINLLGSLV